MKCSYSHIIFARLALLICGIFFFESVLFAGEEKTYPHNEVGILAGICLPMYKDAGEGTVIAISYSNWANSGLGFNTGFRYTSRILHIDNVVGIPIEVSYRTKTHTWNKRLNDATMVAAKSVTDFTYDVPSKNFKNAVFSFLAGLLSNAEFYAGITPGYIFGDGSPTRSTITYAPGNIQNWENSHTELKYRFSTSLDAGLNLNYGIWKFDLKLMPSFHFNLTDNFVIHTSYGDPEAGETRRTVQHARWFFTITGSLTFNF